MRIFLLEESRFSKIVEILSSNDFLCLQERSAKQFEHVVKMNDELKMKVNSLKSARAEQEPEFMKVSYLN